MALSMGFVPRGGTLELGAWRRRHRVILVLLWLHAVILAPLGVLTAVGLSHSVLAAAAVAMLAALASWSRPPRVFRSAAASIGLLTSSGLLVHFSGGYIEVHFHFFVMLAVITLYQDWVPLLLSIVYVVVHHGTVGVLDPRSVYNHEAAWVNPWGWAAIHGGFIMAACAASVAHWRFSEIAQAEARERDRRAMDERRGPEEAVLEVNARLRHALAEVSEQEAQIRQHAARLRLLNEFARSVSGTLDMDSVFGIVTRQVPALVGAVRCSVARREPGGLSRLVAVYPRRENEEGGVPRMGAGAVVEEISVAADQLVEAGGVWLVQDTQGAEEPLLRRLAESGVHASAVVVIFTGSEVWGTLNVGFAEAGAATPERVEILEAVAAHLGVVVKNAELYAAVRSAHEELRRTQAQVVQHERLRALGQMASGIAHDFNNSLAPVVGFSELLLEHPDELEDGERAREYLRLIHTGAQDAAAVVRRLREFYRPRDEETALPWVKLPEIVEQVVGMTQPKWKDEAQRDGRTVTVELDLRPVPPVAGSEAELREALTNLIFNAVDALPQGGTITLRTVATEGEVALEVRDNGVGMDEETRRRCLDPFFTRKGDRGTGLGLAMVWGTVQRHGGTLAIESAPGVGTTVRIGLPPMTDEAEAIREAAARSGAHGRRYRVLVVDDDEGARRVAAAMLKVEGHTAETAATGSEALARLADGGIDVVLTDRAMPGMGGDKLSAAVKQLDARIGVVMMTGFGDMMNAAGERPAGVDVVLGKPISRKALLEALEKAGSALLPL